MSGTRLYKSLQRNSAGQNYPNSHNGRSLNLQAVRGVNGSQEVLSEAYGDVE
jgi:hypothetical protein